jgi:hypothetical protein
MLIWVNSHGTFIIGLAMVGIWFGDEVWTGIRQRISHTQKTEQKRILVSGLMLGITTLVCVLNPRGLGIIDYVKTLTSNSVVQNLVTEWAAPTFGTMMGVLFFIGLIGSAILMVVSPKRPDFFQITSFLVFGILGLKTLRGSVWFGLVMAPIVAQHLAYIVMRVQKTERKPVKPEGSSILNIFFGVLIIAMGVFSLPWFKSRLPLPLAKAGLVSFETPVKATEFLLEENPQGRLFNSVSFGSYLIWAAYPQYKVFVDSRIELFPEKVWLDYLKISNAEGDWESTLMEYGVNTLMLSQIDQPKLIQALDNSASWKRTYKDEVANIYIRNK